MSKEAKLKVLQITPYPPPNGGWGIRVKYIRQEIEKNGDVCAVLNIGSSRLLKNRDFIPVLNGLDYVVKVLKYRLKGYKTHIHLNGDSPKGFALTILAEILCLLTLHRPVLTFHAGEIQLYFPKFRAAYLSLMFKFIFHSAKYVICNHEIVKKSIMSYGIQARKIYPIPAFSRQYVNFEKVKLNSHLEKIFENHSPVLLSYVHYSKNFFLENLILTFYKIKRSYKSSFLLCVGDDEPEDEELAKYAEKITKMIENLGLADSVFFTGDLDRDVFLTLLSKATIYLRTPVKDGVSSAVLEALSLRIPVVASANNIRPQSVITYENRNIKDMIHKIQFAIENNEQIRKSIVPPKLKDTVPEEIEIIKKV